MAIVVLGLNHKTAPVEIRERLHFPEKDLPGPLGLLGALPDVFERLILSTCNRVEIYAVVPEGAAARAPLQAFLAEQRDVPAETFGESLYLHVDAHAVRHVFRVASSLDSMVVGEGQILAQVKAAYALASRHQCTGPILNTLMERALHVAKQVRTDTGIGAAPVSVASVAVGLAQRIFSDLSGRTVMILGAGEMAELALTHLKEEGIHTIIVANRHHERAVELAARVGGRAIMFPQARDEMVGADIVISSTGAPHFILGREDLAEIVRRRHYRPIFLIDIAVPRDVDPQVGTLPNVYCYDIDDLQTVAEANTRERESEAVRAQRIVEQEVERFVRWKHSDSVKPVLKALRRQFAALGEQELQRLEARLKHLPDADRSAMRALVQGLVNKLLHVPSTRLKGMGEDLNGQVFALDARTGRQLWKYHRRRKVVNPYDNAKVNRGVAMLHSFWYQAAEKTFAAVVEKDADCAMAYWGISLANGSGEQIVPATRHCLPGGAISGS